MVIRRTFITEGGIGIYTPDLRKACVLTKQGQKEYTLIELPAILCTGKEELYYMDRLIWPTIKESIYMLIRQILWISFLVKFFFKYFSNMPASRFTFGMYILCWTCYIYFEFIFQIGKIKQNTVAEKQIAKWQGALNKTIRAFEKKGNIPSIEEIKKSKTFFGTRQADWGATDYAVLFLFLFGVSFLTPTLLIQIITAPILVFFGIIAYNHYCWGLLRISYVAKPTEYEIERTLALLKFWYSVSYSEAPITTKQ